MRLVSARVIAVGYVRLDSVRVGSPRHSDAARRADKLQFSVGASRLVVVCRESRVPVPRVVCLHLRFRHIQTYCGTVLVVIVNLACLLASSILNLIFYIAG